MLRNDQRLERWILVILALLIISNYLLLVLKNKTVSKQNDLVSQEHGLADSEVILDSQAFYNEDQFFYAIKKVQASLSQPVNVEKRRIKAAIIPHHQIAGVMMADLLANLSTQQPTIIIHFGPNHYEKGLTNIVTTNASWRTNFGLVKASQNIINRLLALNFVSQDDQVLAEDHTLSTHYPYFKYFLKDVEIVPLLLSYKTTTKQLDELLAVINQIQDKNIILIASIDFSHYLSSQEANLKDEVTWQTIIKRDYSQIRKMNNDFVDSPPSLELFLKYCEQENGEIKQIAHSNSGEISHDPNQASTSHFEIFCLE